MNETDNWMGEHCHRCGQPSCSLTPLKRSLCVLFREVLGGEQGTTTFKMETLRHVAGAEAKLSLAGWCSQDRKRQDLLP